MKKQVDKILDDVKHPESGKGLLEMGAVESISISDDRIAIRLMFERARDPFAKSLSKQVESRLKSQFPEMEGKISVELKERPTPERAEPEGVSKVKRVVAIASGKGGVGKSTVTTNLAVTLASMGYRVGVLDADIYGPSQPRMFGVENHEPEAKVVDGVDLLIPPLALGVKLISIGFFIKESDALVWRGPMATSALKQMIHQCDWGELDYLLVDLPPGTGDVHLTILQELKVDGAVIVTTPQKIATDDVVRGISMFRSKNLNIPVVGIISNMAWFTPAELPNNRYYIFGRGGAEKIAESQNVALLGEIPIVESVMEGGESGRPAAITTPEIGKFYEEVAKNLVDKLP